MRIFTDASTRQAQGTSGIAFIVTNNKDQEIFRNSKLIFENDNNTAELQAILFALKSVKDTDEHITLLTDSAYSINVIRNGYCRDKEAKIVQDIQENLQRLNCSIFWIKGHCQDGTVLSYYNKQADKEAKQVREQYEAEKILTKKLKIQKLRKGRE